MYMLRGCKLKCFQAGRCTQQQTLCLGDVCSVANLSKDIARLGQGRPDSVRLPSHGCMLVLKGTNRASNSYSSEPAA